MGLVRVKDIIIRTPQLSQAHLLRILGASPSCGFLLYFSWSYPFYYILKLGRTIRLCRAERHWIQVCSLQRARRGRVWRLRPPPGDHNSPGQNQVLCSTRVCWIWNHEEKRQKWSLLIHARQDIKFLWHSDCHSWLLRTVQWQRHIIFYMSMLITFLI